MTFGEVKLSEIESGVIAMCLAPAAPEHTALASEAEQKRILIYRNMVRHRFHELAGNVYLRTKVQMGDGALALAVDRWMAERGPRSRFFRDMAVEIGDFMLEGELDPLARDLLQLERARWMAGIALDPEPAPLPFSLESICVTAPSLVTFRSAHAVHVGGEDRPLVTHYAVYRKPDLDLTTRWFNPTLAHLLSGWAEGERPAIEVVRSVLAQEAREASPAFVQEMTSFLATLIEEGAIVGSR
jgi:hypothetical protein